MERNTIIAIVLSLLIWVGWSYFFPAPKPAVQNAATTQSAAESGSGKTDEETSAAAPAASEPAAEVVAVAAADETLTEEKVSISKKWYDITLSNKDAAIISLKYGERKIEVITSHQESSGIISFPFFFSKSAFLDPAPAEGILWSIAEKSADKVVFAKRMIIAGTEVTVNKIYSFGDEHNFSVSYRFLNESTQAVNFPSDQIAFATPDFLGPAMDTYTNVYNNVYSVYEADKFRKVTKGGGKFLFWGSDPKDITVKEGEVKWAGLSSRYFSLLVKPENVRANQLWLDTRRNNIHRTALVVPETQIAAGGARQFNFKVALAPKERSVLRSADPVFENAADSNKWVEPIREGVLWILKQMKRVIPNYGWCIIIFSVLTKLVFFPLTQKSAVSMKKMSALQPEIKKLQEKYKGKPEEMQKRTMELYKAKGVNPMGGCLPLLIQMPFFIALYSALSNTVDMWNAPFLFWITDLSRPDAAFAIAGFDINILPLFMGATQFLQQHLAQQDSSGTQQQQMMIKMMPLIMLFMFWSMPSGLILYWTVQNILQIGQQMLVNKK